MIRHSGTSPAWERWSSPGRSLRRARSPVAPNMTTTCGCVGGINLVLMSLGSLWAAVTVRGAYPAATAPLAVIHAAEQARDGSANRRL
jgi:hypothetical protein